MPARTSPERRASGSRLLFQLFGWIGPVLLVVGLAVGFNERRIRKDLEGYEAVLAKRPVVKELLGISNDAGLEKVMAEILRLAHTRQYSTKEVEEIAVRERETLLKISAGAV